MAQVLIGSFTSPYVRKIRLLLHGNKNIEFKSINYLEKADSDYLKSVNPINQIPVFIDGDQTIYDSRVIYNYLAKKEGWKPLSIEEENILSAIDAAMDSAINLFSLRRGGLDLNGGNPYVERQKERVPLILNYLTNWAKSQTPEKDWNFLTMSLYSFIYWGIFREIIDINPHPEMLAFIERFKNCPGVQETDIPKA